MAMDYLKDQAERAEEEADELDSLRSSLAAANERREALEAKCALLAASLKQADARTERAEEANEINLQRGNLWRDDCARFERELERVVGERDEALRERDALKERYRLDYELLKDFDNYGTGGDVGACAREVLMVVSELRAALAETRRRTLEEAIAAIDEAFGRDEDVAAQDVLRSLLGSPE